MLPHCTEYTPEEWRNMAKECLEHRVECLDKANTPGDTWKGLHLASARIHYHRARQYVRKAFEHECLFIQGKA